MNVESIPKFTGPAAKLWATIPADAKSRLLANVWCGRCRHEVTITNFTGVVKAGDLLLVGVCAGCRENVVMKFASKHIERLAPHLLLCQPLSVT